MDYEVPEVLFDAARIVARTGLSDAFGHVSTRVAADTFAMTPVTPLGLLQPDFTPVTVRLDAVRLPVGAPKEAWLHVALMQSKPNIGAVCRAQPPNVAAISALHIDLAPLSGHGAVLGPVATYPSSWLVRSSSIANEVADAMGEADTVILRGNGAVSRGASLGDAVARMWLLERLAELTLRSLAAGTPVPLAEEEAAWWYDQAHELLPRIYTYLSNTHRLPELQNARPQETEQS